MSRHFKDYMNLPALPLDLMQSIAAYTGSNIDSFRLFKVYSGPPKFLLALGRSITIHTVSNADSFRASKSI